MHKLSVKAPFFFLAVTGFLLSAAIAVGEPIGATSIGSGYFCLGSSIYNKKSNVVKFASARKKVSSQLKKLKGKKGKKVISKTRNLKNVRIALTKCNKGILVSETQVTLSVSLNSELCTTKTNDVTLSINPPQEGREIQLQISNDGGSTWSAVTSTSGTTSGDSSASFHSPDDAGIYHYRAYSPASGNSPAVASPAFQATASPCGGNVITAKLPLVRAGGTHSCLIDADGTTWCWGKNNRGQLGEGTNTDSPRPVRVAGGHKFQFLALGYTHTCALESDGSAWCWGADDIFSSISSVPVYTGMKFIDISLSDSHTCGILVTGATLCWGENTFGQLGNGVTPVHDPDYNPTKFNYDKYNSKSPVQVVGAANYVQIEVMDRHSCARTSSGQVDCWGGGKENSPVLRLSGYSNISLGGYGICGVTASGVGSCAGFEVKGDFGDGTGANKPVSGGINFAYLSKGETHGCGISPDGKAYCWGNNQYGAVGDGAGSGKETDIKYTPSEVAGNIVFEHIHAGYGHSCGVSDKAGIYCWGFNAQGQIGDGSSGLADYRSSPRLIAIGSPS